MSLLARIKNAFRKRPVSAELHIKGAQDLEFSNIVIDSNGSSFGLFIEGGSSCDFKNITVRGSVRGKESA